MMQVIEPGFLFLNPSPQNLRSTIKLIDIVKYEIMFLSLRLLLLRLLHLGDFQITSCLL